MNGIDANGSKKGGWLLPCRRVANETDLLGNLLVLSGPVITTYPVKEKHSHQTCK